jgi:hypothetical protein
MSPVRAWLCALAAGLAAGAVVADAAESEDPLRKSLRICAAIRNTSERLACYDRIVGSIAAGKEAQAPRASPEDLFGVEATPSPRTPPDENAAEELTSITARVKSLNTLADGTLTIELDNGQTWRATGGTRLVLEAGDTVTISRAALGTFRMATPGNRFARVRRVR